MKVKKSEVPLSQLIDRAFHKKLEMEKKYRRYIDSLGRLFQCPSTFDLRCIEYENAQKDYQEALAEIDQWESSNP